MSISRPTSRKTLASTLLRLAGFITSLIVLWYIVDVPRAVGMLSSFSVATILVAYGMAMSRAWLVSVRWRLLNPDTTQQWTMFDYFRYTMISSTFNMIMPGALGGDVVRGAFVIKDAKGEVASNLFSMFTDRIVGLFSILVLGTVCCIFANDLEHRLTYLAVFSALIVAFVVGAWLATCQSVGQRMTAWAQRFGRPARRLTDLIGTWHEVVQFYRDNRARVLSAFLTCFAVHGVWFIVVYSMARELEISIGFLGISMITAISWLVTTLPITFAGLGVRELSFVYLIGTQGGSAESATALSFGQFAISLLIAISGVPFIWVRRHRPAET